MFLSLAACLSSLLVACIIWAILLLTTRLPALLAADKRQKEALGRLKQKNRWEEDAINKAPPPEQLRKNNKKRKASTGNSAAVLKPYQSTPARRPSNDTTSVSLVLTLLLPAEQATLPLTLLWSK